MAQARCDLQLRLLVCLIIIGAVGAVGATNPGIQVRILPTGFKKVVEHMMGLFEKRLNTEELKRVDKTEGKLKYSFYNIRMTSFTKPESRVEISDTTGVTWIATKGQLTVGANWTIVWDNTFRDTGTITATVETINFRISVLITKDDAGRLQARSTGCQCTLSNLIIRVSESPLSIFYELILSRLEVKFRQSLQKSLCRKIEETVNEDFSQKLARVKLSRPVDGGRIVFNYDVISPLYYVNNYLQMQFKGAFCSATDPKPCTVAPDAFPAPDEALPRMLYIWGSDVLVNSFSETVFKQNRVRSYLSDELPQILQEFMRTTCPSVFCFGYFFPLVKTKYPDSKVILNLTATSPPKVRMSPNGVRLTIVGELTALVNNGMKGHVVLFKLAVEANVLLNIILAGNLVKGAIESMRICVLKTLYSDLGDLPIEGIERVLDILGETYIVPNLNDFGKNGILIPHVDGIYITRAILQKFEGGLLIAADISWIKDDSEGPIKPTKSLLELPPCRNSSTIEDSGVNIDGGINPNDKYLMIGLIAGFLMMVFVVVIQLVVCIVKKRRKRRTQVTTMSKEMERPTGLNDTNPAAAIYETTSKKDIITPEEFLYTDLQKNSIEQRRRDGREQATKTPTGTEVGTTSNDANPAESFYDTISETNLTMKYLAGAGSLSSDSEVIDKD